jgi:hypothetical protein
MTANRGRRGAVASGRAGTTLDGDISLWLLTAADCGLSITDISHVLPVSPKAGALRLDVMNHYSAGVGPDVTRTGVEVPDVSQSAADRAGADGIWVPAGLLARAGVT